MDPTHGVSTGRSLSFQTITFPTALHIPLVWGLFYQDVYPYAYGSTICSFALQDSPSNHGLCEQPSYPFLLSGMSYRLLLLLMNLRRPLTLPTGSNESTDGSHGLCEQPSCLLTSYHLLLVTPRRPLTLPTGSNASTDGSRPKSTVSNFSANNSRPDSWPDFNTCSINVCLLTGVLLCHLLHHRQSRRNRGDPAEILSSCC